MSIDSEDVYQICRRMERMRTIIVNMTSGNLAHHRNELEFLVDTTIKYVCKNKKENPNEQ